MRSRSRARSITVRDAAAILRGRKPEHDKPPRRRRRTNLVPTGKAMERLVFLAQCEAEAWAARKRQMETPAPGVRP